jgi:hypothetical protein
MAKNIGTFTAAGVDLEDGHGLDQGHRQPGSALRIQLAAGFDGDVSAVAGHFLGSVGLQDWNSVVNAGMGGTVFQRALATTAKQMGTLKDRHAGSRADEERHDRGTVVP